MSNIQHNDVTLNLEETQLEIPRAMKPVERFFIKGREIVVCASMKGNAHTGDVMGDRVVYGESREAPQILRGNFYAEQGMTAIKVGRTFPIFDDPTSETIGGGPNVWRIDELRSDDETYELRLFVGGNIENCSVYEITVLRKKVIEEEIKEIKRSVDQLKIDPGETALE
jgi:hypothetical protein